MSTKFKKPENSLYCRIYSNVPFHLRASGLLNAGLLNDSRLNFCPFIFLKFRTQNLYSRKSPQVGERKHLKEQCGTAGPFQLE